MKRMVNAGKVNFIMAKGNRGEYRGSDGKDISES